MCGIAGFFFFKKADRDLVRSHFKDLEVRGEDAAGIAIIQRNWRITIMKKPEKPSKFINQVRLPKAFGYILHARAATHGDPRNNSNNHPIEGQRGFIVHNGIVSGEMPRQWRRRSETDTEILLAHIETEGWKGIEKVRGSAAFCYVPYHERAIYLYRKGNPLYVFYDSDRAIFAFSSLSRIRGLGKRFRVFFSTCMKEELPEETLYKVRLYPDKFEVEEIGKFEMRYYFVGYTRLYPDDYLFGRYTPNKTVTYERCDRCGKWTTNYEQVFLDGDIIVLCQDCFAKAQQEYNLAQCQVCGVYYPANWLTNGVCIDCEIDYGYPSSKGGKKCEICGKDNAIFRLGDYSCCSQCYDKYRGQTWKLTRCAGCGKVCDINEMRLIDMELYCKECAEKRREK